MATNFKVWVDDANISGNVQGHSTFASDSQRSNGFQPNNAASAIRVNSALRQANLIACAFMETILPNNNTLNLQSSVTEVVDALIAAKWPINVSEVNGYTFDGDFDDGFTIEETGADPCNLLVARDCIIGDVTIGSGLNTITLDNFDASKDNDLEIVVQFTRGGNTQYEWNLKVHFSTNAWTIGGDYAVINGYQVSYSRFNTLESSPGFVEILFGKKSDIANNIVCFVPSGSLSTGTWKILSIKIVK